MTMCLTGVLHSVGVRNLNNGLIALVLGMFLVIPAAKAGDVQGKVSVSGITSPDSIVVYMDSMLDAKFEQPVEHAVVHQKQMAFIPHVLAVMRGTTVDFWNDDSVNHGVSWPSVGGNKKLAHYLGIWSQGLMKSYTFDEPGIVPLLCYLHPEMYGYIVVLPTPYFAITDATGGFLIKDVPPGEHTLKVWSERGEPISQALRVAESITSLNLVVQKSRNH